MTTYENEDEMIKELMWCCHNNFDPKRYEQHKKWLKSDPSYTGIWIEDGQCHHYAEATTYYEKKLLAESKKRFKM